MSDPTPIEVIPPPRSSAVDPYGLQTGSTTATGVGAGLIAASEAGSTIASALGLSASSAKVLTAGLSLSALGHVSLFSAGLVLIGLGIVLNVASLVVRRQLAGDYENEYRAAKAAEERRAKEEEQRAKKAEKQPPPSPPPPPSAY